MRNSGDIAWRFILRFIRPGTSPGATLILIHSGYRWYPREWYYAPVSFTIALYLGLVYSFILPKLEGLQFKTTTNKSKLKNIESPNRYLNLIKPAFRTLLKISDSPGRAVFTGVLITFLFQGTLIWKYGLYPGQSVFIEYVDTINKYFDKDTRVGISDCGFLAYYSNPTIINLDGVANNDAYLAIKRGNLFNYLKRSKIDFIAYSRNDIFNHVYMGEDFPTGFKEFYIGSKQTKFYKVIR